MRCRQVIVILASTVLAGAVLGASGAVAPPAEALDAAAQRDLAARARVALEAERFDDASELYEQLQAARPDLVQIPYNRAIAEHGRGAYEQAAELLESTLRRASAPSIRARAAHNLLANTAAQVAPTLQGVTTANQETQQALEAAPGRIDAALEELKSQVRSRPEDRALRRDVEYGERLLRQLQQQQEQQQEQQQQSQSQQNQDEQQQDQQQQGEQQQDQQQQGEQQQDQQQQGDRQQDQQQQGEQQQDQQQQQGEQQQDQQQQGEQQQDQQQQGEQQQDQQQQGEQQQDQQQQGEQQQDQQQQGEQQQDQQQQGEQQQDQQQQGEQQQDHPQPGDEPRDEQQQDDAPQPGENDGQGEDESETGGQDGAGQDGTAGGKPRSDMTREEAERLLQQVRDKERQRREERARRRRQEAPGVDKDW